MNQLPKLSGFHLQNDNWFAENVSLLDIANQFGTPCYVYSKKALTQAFMAYESACLRKDGTRRARVHFAMKSNSNLAILDVFAQLGAGFDLVSGGELERVIAAGVNDIAGQLGLVAPISLRVNPDVDAKTHPYISTGLKDNKFGIAYESVLATYAAAKSMPNCNIVGIDCHIGSQILDIQPYLDALDRVLLLIEQLRDQGINIHHLDIGGGLGIDYGGDIAPDITLFANTLLNHIEKRGFGFLDVIFEPGRSLVGNAGVLLTRIEYLKPTDAKNFCVVDAAMNDLMRPAMYDAFHSIVPVVNKSLLAETYDVVGPVCESGDWLGKDRLLSVVSGDLLAILSAGAYGSTMSSNYNTRPRAAEVMVSDTSVHLIRERETVQSLFALEHLLPK